MLMERAKKAQVSIEQMTTELAQERGQVQKYENSKMLLERQNKELKAKLQELETSQRAKAKATIAALRESPSTGSQFRSPKITNSSPKANPPCWPASSTIQAAFFGVK